MTSILLNLAVGLVTNQLLGLLSPKEGPRIMDLSAPKSAYGQMIPEIVGNCLVGCNMFWAQPKREVKRKSGKGTGAKGTLYSYYGDFAVLVCKGPIVGISRIWLNDRIVYDMTADPAIGYPSQNNPPTNPPNGTKFTVGSKPTGLWSGHEYEIAEWQNGRWYFYPAGSTSRAATNRFSRYVRIYNGNSTQNPDPLIQSKEGVSRTPAFRGIAYIVFEGLPLTDNPGELFDFGGNFPRVKVEVINSGYRHPVDGYFVREETQLSEALTYFCKSVGIQESEIETDCVTGNLWGYAVTSQRSARDCIADLASIYHFDLLDSLKLKFLPPERESAVTINTKDLAAHEANGERSNNYTHTIAETISLPYEVALVYFSRERDYQENMVYGRYVTANILNKNTTQLPIVLQGWQAQTAVNIAIHLVWIRRHTYRFALAFKYLRLQSGDRISIDFGFGIEDLVLTKIDIGANLLLNCEAYRYSDLANYGKYEAVATPIMPAPSTITFQGDTVFYLLDIPFIKDTETDYGMYIAARGSVPKWRSGSVYYSTDGGANYSLSKQFTSASTMGVALNTLGSWSSSGIDTTNTITVELESGELAAPTGLFLLGNEILSANSVTLTDVKTYQLGNLVRGQRGTDWAIAGHQANERFYLLSTVQRVSGTLADLNQTYLYKGITSGQSLEDVTATSFTYTNKDLEPYPVINPIAYLIGSDIAIKWNRRDRHDAAPPAGSAPKLSEFAERYEIDILNGASVVRTITATAPEIAYLSSQQITDFGAVQTQVRCIIYQMSEVVGRGFPKYFGSGTLTSTVPSFTNVTPTTSSLANSALQRSQNLADLTSPALARQNLGVESFVNQSVKTSNYTASNYDRIPCNTSGGSFAITLPATGIVWIFDSFGNNSITGFGANPLTVTPPSGTIMGSSSLVLNIGGSGVILQKIGTDWRVINYANTDIIALIQSTIRSFLVAGANVSISYNGGTNKLEISASGGVGPTTYLLDDFPTGLLAGWSLRQISSTTTSIIRVRRALDNQLQNFTGIEIANGTLSTWCNGGAGYLETWYDQSGNGIHASQSSLSLQPQIVDIFGNVILQNGKPSILFNGSQYLENTSQGLTSGSYSGYLSLFAVNRRTSSSGGAFLTERDTTKVKSFQIFNYTTDYYISSDGAAPSSNQTTDSTAYSATSNLNIWTQRQFSSGLDSLWINGTGRTVSAPVGGGNTVTDGSSGLRIGVREGSVGAGWNGYISEMIGYGIDIDAARIDIETAINNHYAMY